MPVKIFVYEHAGLERLAHPHHRGEEVTLGPAGGTPPRERISLLSRYVSGMLGFQVQVEDVEGSTVGQPDPGVEDRPLPAQLLRRYFGRIGGHQPVGWRRGEVVLVLMVVQDLMPAQYDQVTQPVELRAVLDGRGDPVVARVRRLFEEFLERREPALPNFLLAMDLLEAQYVGFEPYQLRTHHLDALLQHRIMSIGHFVEVLQVEGRNPQLGGHNHPSGSPPNQALLYLP